MHFITQVGKLFMANIANMELVTEHWTQKIGEGACKKLSHVKLHLN